MAPKGIKYNNDEVVKGPGRYQELQEMKYQ